MNAEILDAFLGHKYRLKSLKIRVYFDLNQTGDEPDRTILPFFATSMPILNAGSLFLSVFQLLRRGAICSPEIW
jgi:hypothetical protein